MHTQDDATRGTMNRRTEEGASRRAGWFFGGLAAIGLLLLAFEHRSHVLDWLPWALLAACPLVHLFMHRGHGHSGSISADRKDE